MLSGPGYLLRGVSTWRRRPALMLLGMVPALVVLLALIAALVALLFFVDDLVVWGTPFLDGGDDVLAVVVRATLAIALVAGCVVLAVVLFVTLTLAVGEPVYQRIWSRTERDLGGEVPDSGVSLLRGVRDGARLLGLAVATGVGVTLVGLVPLVGAVAAAALGFLLAGWLLAGELLARPLEARGMDAADRARLLRRRRGAVLGFGVSVQACFLVPLGAVLIMPAAVVGATMLARDLLAQAAPEDAPAGRPAV